VLDVSLPMWARDGAGGLLESEGGQPPVLCPVALPVASLTERLSGVGELGGLRPRGGVLERPRTWCVA